MLETGTITSTVLIGFVNVMKEENNLLLIYQLPLVYLLLKLIPILIIDLLKKEMS